MPSDKQIHNSLPVYVRVAERLIDDIAAGRLIDGERLPPERDMAKQFEISVGTLRKSLALLEDRTLLKRVHGSGNYIDAKGLRDTVYAMFRLELRSGGGLPRARILGVDHMQKPDDLPEFGASNDATRIRRLRLLDDTIVAIEEIWLDGSVGPLSRSAIRESLYRTYLEAFGLWISRAEDQVSIGHVPAWTPEEFTLREGAVSGYVERFSWGEDPVPVEFSRNWFDPNRSVYVQRIK